MSRKARVTTKEETDHSPRRRFLEGLFARTKGITALDYELLPSSPDFLRANTGVGGLSFRFVVGMDGSRVELYIASRDATANERLFEELLRHKGEIEKSFGEPLSWENLEGSKSCRIAYRLVSGGASYEAKWKATQAALVDTMIRFEKALLPFVTSRE
jgi:hypothetical protein